MASLGCLAASRGRSLALVRVPAPGGQRVGTTALDSATVLIPAGVERCSSCRGLPKCAHLGEHQPEERRVAVSSSRWPPALCTSARRSLRPCSFGLKENDMSTSQGTNTPAPTLTPEAVVDQLRAV